MHKILTQEDMDIIDNCEYIYTKTVLKKPKMEDLFYQGN